MFTISKKKKNNIDINILGQNAEGVTGSCTKIKCFDQNILFEFGTIQEMNTTLENYKANAKLISKVKCKDIDMVIIGHCHCDHIGNIPTLFAKGNNKVRIIVPKGSTPILKEMWLDSSYINQRDAELLNKKFDKNSYQPFYTDKEVVMALERIEEYDCNEIFPLNDTISIRYTPAGHILCSCQTELYIKNNSHIKKILFTSDLGNRLIEKRKFFVEPFSPIHTANIVIGECTYGNRTGSMSKKDISLDQNKLKTIITQYCIENNRRILIPTFSLDRMPFIIWELYKLFGEDPTFNIPILIDSPLSNRLLDCYSEILTDEKKKKFDQMLSWSNIRRIITPEESKKELTTKGAKIICASSGMMTAGRSVKWTQSILPNENDAIVFIGYAGLDTLAGKIKNNRKQKTININGKPIKNKANIIDLHSYSSHMQRNDLLNYYKSIRCEKIYLVHSDKQARLEFKEDLEKELNNILKTTHVVCVNKGVKIKL